MFLAEIFDKPLSADHQLFNALVRYVQLSTGKSTDPESRYAKHVIQNVGNHPNAQDFLYNGKMYRFMVFNPKYNPPLKDGGIDVDKIISRGGIASFASEETGIESYIENTNVNTEGNYLLYISQTGKGYALSKMAEYFKSKGFDVAALVEYEEEYEVIAPYYPSTIQVITNQISEY